MNSAALIPLAEIPSPTQSVWYLGSVPIRAYALCIVLGIVAACAVTEIRMRRRGAPPWVVLDIAVWAVPFGIVGARIYHVITSPDDYFGKDGVLLDAFKIWHGGLGIWGAVAGGALGAWIAARRMGIPLAFVAGALAPGLPLAQGIGRWGNWFNNELHGGQTSLPWGLKVYQMDANLQGKAATDVAGHPLALPGLYHPTFLYESLWDIGVAILVWQLDKRYRFGRGRAFALYVMAYTVGRFWIEAMRNDAAHSFLGMRVNNWMSIVVFIGALVYFLRVRGPQERLLVTDTGEIQVITDGSPAGSGPATDSAPATRPDVEPPGNPASSTPAADAEPAATPEPAADAEPAAGAEPAGQAGPAGGEPAAQKDAAARPDAAQKDAAAQPDPAPGNGGVTASESAAGQDGADHAPAAAGDTRPPGQ